MNNKEKNIKQTSNNNKKKQRNMQQKKSELNENRKSTKN